MIYSTIRKTRVCWKDTSSFVASWPRLRTTRSRCQMAAWWRISRPWSADLLCFDQEMVRRSWNLGLDYWWHDWSDFEMVLKYHFYIFLYIFTYQITNITHAGHAFFTCGTHNMLTKQTGQRGVGCCLCEAAKPNLLQLRKWDLSPKLAPEAWIYQTTWRVRTWHLWTCEIYGDLRVHWEANVQNSHAKPSLQDQKVDLSSVGKYLSAQAAVIVRNAQVILQFFMTLSCMEWHDIVAFLTLLVMLMEHETVCMSAGHAYSARSSGDCRTATRNAAFARRIWCVLMKLMEQQFCKLM